MPSALSAAVMSLVVERKGGFVFLPTTGWLSWWGAGLLCGDRGSIPGRTNTQGLKITEEKVLPL